MSVYPEIITELIKKAKSDELRHFNLSSFMSDTSLEDVFGKIDRTMSFFSVYIVEEFLQEDLWDDPRYMDQESAQLCSLVEAEVRKYWWDRNREHLKRIDARVEALKNNPEFKDIKESALRDKAIEELDKKMFPWAIERVKENYQEIYENEWEEYWEKEDPFKPRTEIRYHRRYDMPKPFNHWDTRNMWQQYYFAKDRNTNFYYTQGGSGSSYQRYNHGFYGHLFALLNKEKPVPTYFFKYDSRNNFIFVREESKRILKDVTTIRDKL